MGIPTGPATQRLALLGVGLLACDAGALGGADHHRFPGNPYDGHVLSAQLEQTANLLQDTGRSPKQVVVDLGYRGVDADNPGVQIIHRGKYKSMRMARKALQAGARPSLIARHGLAHSVSAVDW